MAHLNSNNEDTLFLDDSVPSCQSLPLSAVGGPSERDVVYTSLSSEMGSTRSAPVLSQHVRQNRLGEQTRGTDVGNGIGRRHCSYKSVAEGEPRIHEDVDANGMGPPKITPFSGVLSKGKVVIRPIAFKPVVPSSGNRYSSMPSVSAASPANDVVASIGSTNGSSDFLRPVPAAHRLGGSVSRINVGVSTGSLSSVVVSSSSVLSCLEAQSPLYFSESELKSSSSTATPIQYGTSQGSLHILDGLRLVDDSRSATYSTTDSCIKLSDTPASYLSNLSRGSVPQLDDFTQTPSPSDSGVAELEAMLKEKDSEINYLRETMEQNEQVIFKVYKEKEVSWQKEAKRIRAQYENKLQACQQRALKMEQVLTMQTYQLQQEKRKLRQEHEEAKREKETAEQRYEEVRVELELVRGQLEETEWTMCQKSGEISLLKSQLKDSQGDQTSRAVELLQLRSQLREARAAADSKERENKELHDQVSSLKRELGEVNGKYQALQADVNERRKMVDASQDLKKELERLNADVELAKQSLSTQRHIFEEERVQWLEEKEKVIRYQKQLQLNYVQMYRRNRTLESEVEQLTLELEGRDLKMINGESQC